ncbi:MAG: hypothetical protein ACXVZO_10335, partial [Gaiellaceae bacterium]
MARRLIVVTALVTLLAAFLSQAGGSATAPPAGASTTGLATGIVDPWEFGGTRAQQAFDNVRKTGASYVRIYLIW